MDELADFEDSLSFSDDDLELSLPDTSDVREAGIRQAKIEREMERSGEEKLQPRAPAASADAKPSDDLEGTTARRPATSSHTNTAALSPPKGWDAAGLESCSDVDDDNSVPAPKRAAPMAPHSSGSSSELLSRPTPATALPAVVAALGARSVRGVAGSDSRFAPTAEVPSEDEDLHDSPSLDSTWNSQEFSVGISGDLQGSSGIPGASGLESPPTACMRTAAAAAATAAAAPAPPPPPPPVAPPYGARCTAPAAALTIPPAAAAPAATSARAAAAPLAPIRGVRDSASSAVSGSPSRCLSSAPRAATLPAAARVPNIASTASALATAPVPDAARSPALASAAAAKVEAPPAAATRVTVPPPAPTPVPAATEAAAAEVLVPAALPDAAAAAAAQATRGGRRVLSVTRRSPSGRLLSRVGGASVQEGGQGETANQRDGFSAVAHPNPVTGPASGVHFAVGVEKQGEESAAAAAAAAAAAVKEAGLQPAAAATIPSWARSMQGGDSRGVVMSMDDMFASDDDEPAAAGPVSSHSPVAPPTAPRISPDCASPPPSSPLAPSSAPRNYQPAATVATSASPAALPVVHTRRQLAARRDEGDEGDTTRGGGGQEVDASQCGLARASALLAQAQAVSDRRHARCMCTACTPRTSHIYSPASEGTTPCSIAGAPHWSSSLRRSWQPACTA